MSGSAHTFPGMRESAREARDWAREHLERFGVCGASLDDVLLVLSELVTNAVLHSNSSGPWGSVVVRLWIEGTQVWLEVTDQGGAGEPRSRSIDQVEFSSEFGRGLALVELYTTRWWTMGDRQGRTVGAELNRDHRGVSRSGAAEITPGESGVFRAR